jgi:signal transduction histidine kinase
MSAIRNGPTLSRTELLDLERIASISAGSLSIEPVYDAVDHIVGRLIDNDGLILNLLESDGTRFTVSVRTGNTPTNRTPGQTYNLKGTVLESIVDSSAPIRATAESSEDAIVRFPGLEGAYKTGYRSWLGVPLYAHGELIGGLHVQRSAPIPFSDHDVELLQRVAVHVGATTGKHRSINDRDRQMAHARVLLEVGRILTQTNDLKQAVVETAQALKNVMPIDRFVVSMWNDHTQSMIDVERWGMDIPVWDDLVNKPNKVLDSSHFDLEKTVMVVSTQTILEASIGDQPALKYAADVGLVSMMVAALVEERHRSGNISVRSTQTNAYNDDSARLFQEIAAQFTHYLAAHKAREAERHAVRDREQAITDRKVAIGQLKLQQAQDRIIDSISHELRTPLTVITARTGILTRRLAGQDEKVLSSLTAIQRSSSELKSLINRLIEHADRTMAVSQAELIEVTVALLEKALSLEIATRFKNRDIRLSLEAPKDSSIMCDLEQLVSATAELVDNSVKYGPNDSSIFVDIKVDAGQAKLSVIDAGTNLSVREVSELFELFERGEQIGNAETRGTGLGLPYVSTVAKSLHGKVGFENDPKRGTIFSIEFPAAAV